MCLYVPEGLGSPSAIIPKEIPGVGKGNVGG